ncbi:MAG: zinc-binding alcohol dehydrogenase family protein [Granulosicoccus sp.]
MKAVGYSKMRPIADELSLEDIVVDDPVPGARDLLVEIKAISVNPVDTKVRQRAEPDTGHKILGWDASGVVRSVGTDVVHYKVGDEVFYAGALDRPGVNSELHAVDERIVGRKPATLSHADAAALPLTAITAWELLFDRFAIPMDGGENESLLIIGGAGGVGSMMIQLAATFTQLNVIATASRPDTIDWCKKMGAHHVISHRADMSVAMEALGFKPKYVAGLTATDQHFEFIADVIAPQGKFGLIDDPDATTINISLLKQKSVSLHWEFMFTRSLMHTDDIEAQRNLLNRVSDAVDSGKLLTTSNREMGVINAANLKEAHAFQESGKAIGKTVLVGFDQ